MKVTPIKTRKITDRDRDLFVILDRYVKKLPENSILAVTSKIVSITEGRTIPIGEVDKNVLIEQEAEYSLPRSSSKYDVRFTITNNILAAAAGIDESNGGGYYILWPENPQKSADAIREHLVKKFKRKHIGVIITDSKATPLRWGVTGIALSHSGFNALNNYIGKPDLFDRKFAYEKVNVMDGLAAAATLTMGEGKESTPLAIIENVSFVTFQKRNPTPKELADLHISMNDDLFAPLLKNAKWKKGKMKKLQI